MLRGCGYLPATWSSVPGAPREELRSSVEGISKIKHTIPMQKKDSYPEPKHHLEERIAEDHAVLQAIQASNSRSAGVRRNQVGASGLVDEERNTRIYSKTARSDCNPNTPVDRQGLGDILGQALQDLQVLRGEVAVSQGSDVGQGVVEGFVEGNVG